MHALFVVGILAAVCAVAVMMPVAKRKANPREHLDDDIRKLYEVLARAERYDPANQRAHHRR